MDSDFIFFLAPHQYGGTMNNKLNDKKKKVGLITFHLSYNFGAALQAYSLQEAINELGCECWLLNYYFQHGMDFYGIRPYASLKGKIFDFLITPKRLLQHKAYHQYQRRFYRNTTPMTKKWEDLAVLSKDCEVLVCGSDQIWNPDKGDITPYFLKFALPYQRKVSYAPSVNFYRLEENLIPAYRELLMDFDAISVREEATAEQLSSMIEKPVFCALDPTLLHSREFFDAMLSQNEGVSFPGRFIFVYCLNTSKSKRKRLFTFAEKYARKHHVKIVYFSKIDSFGRLYSKNIFVNDPLVFLKAVKDAEFVITDSFHACVFSIIYHKQFVYGIDSIRINDLIQRLGIQNRMINGDLDINSEINYDVVEDKLLSLRKDSLAFLKQAIMGTEETEVMQKMKR